MMTRQKYFLLFFIFFILIQFIRIDKTNPPVDSTQDYLSITQPSAALQTTIKAACYDCHSNEIEYPWYTNVAPVSWWIKGHINGGKEHLNFSEWANYSTKKADHKLEECVEMLEKKWMPLKSYTWLHPEAKLSDAQREELIAWFKK